MEPFAVIQIKKEKKFPIKKYILGGVIALLIIGGLFYLQRSAKVEAEKYSCEAFRLLPNPKLEALKAYKNGAKYLDGDDDNDPCEIYNK